MDQRTSTFMMHCGAQAVNVADVANVVTPANTATHYPVPHIALYENFKDRLADTGLRIVDEQHALHTKHDIDGCNWFGLFELESERSDYNLVAAMRNSHGKDYSMLAGLGDRAFVCDNLAFNIEFQLSRKHTRNIFRDLPQLVSRAVAGLMDQRIRQDQRIELYRDAVLTPPEADHLIMDMARARVVAPNKVIPVYNEFIDPSHDEHLNADGERTVWTLRNAVTEVYKDCSVFTLPKRCAAMHGILDARAEVVDAIAGEFEVLAA